MKLQSNILSLIAASWNLALQVSHRWVRMQGYCTHWPIWSTCDFYKLRSSFHNKRLKLLTFSWKWVPRVTRARNYPKFRPELEIQLTFFWTATNKVYSMRITTWTAIACSRIAVILVRSSLVKHLVKYQGAIIECKSSDIKPQLLKLWSTYWKLQLWDHEFIF